MHRPLVRNLVKRLPPGSNSVLRKADADTPIVDPPEDPSDDDEASHRRTFGELIRQIGPVRRLLFRRSAWNPNRHHAKLHLDFMAEMDQWGRLEDGEDLHLAGIWVTEIYLPSNIDALIAGLDGLGWRQGRLTQNEDLANWVRDSRSRPLQTRSIGFVVSPDHPNFTAHFTTRLPSGMRAAFPQLHTLSSGLSAMVVLFIPETSIATRPTEILNAEYEEQFALLPPPMMSGGFVRRIAKRIGWRVLPKWLLTSGEASYSPSIRRRAAIRDFFEEQRRACSEWVEAQLPGSFASLNDGAELPSIQLLTTEVDAPLRPDTDNDAFAYSGLTHSRLAWASRGWPAARMVEGASSDEPTNRSLVIGCRRSDAIDPRFREGRDDDTSDWSIAQFADDQVQGLLVRWASTNLLRAHRQRLGRLRDALAADTQRPTAVHNLKRTRRLIATEALDAQVASYEVRRLAKDELLFRWQVLDMIEAEPTAPGKPAHTPEDFIAGLRNGQIEQSDELAEELGVLTNTLSTVNSITSAVSNIRLQRVVILFTAASVGLAIWAVVQRH